MSGEEKGEDRRPFVAVLLWADAWSRWWVCTRGGEYPGFKETVSCRVDHRSKGAAERHAAALNRREEKR